MDPGQDEAQIVLQHKKDQFRVEIRKKKTDKFIQQKRLKLFNKSYNPQDNGAEDGKEDNFVNQDQQLGISQIQKSNLDVKVIQDLEERIQKSQQENNIDEIRFLLNQLALTVGVNPSPIDQVFQTNLPKILINILNKSSPITDQRCKIFAAHVIANLTSGNAEQLNELFQLDLFQIILDQIESKEPELAECVIFAFNNVLVDNHQPQNLIRIFEVCKTIIESLCYYFTIQFRKSSIQRQLISSVILCLYFLTRVNRVSEEYYSTVRVCVPYLCSLLDQNHPKQVSQIKNNIINANFNQQMNNNENQQISNNENNSNNNQTSNDNRQNKQRFLSKNDLLLCVSIISELSKGNPCVISDMFKSQVDKVMLKYLEQGLEINDQFLAHVIKTLANMSSGNDFQTDKLLKIDIYSYIINFIDHPLDLIRKDIFWLISNLAACNPQQIEVFIKNQMIQTLIHRLNIEQSINVKQEILYALCNSTSQATKEQINVMVKEGLLRALSENLDPQFSVELLVELLEGIENIMESGVQDNMNSCPNVYKNEFEGCGCLKKIQDLYYQHNNEIVTEICNKIMKSIS